MALHPDRHLAYVTNNDGGTVSVIDTSTNQVTGFPITIPPSRNYLGELISTPDGVAFSPNGRYAYVTDEGNIFANRPGGVSVIDTSTHPRWQRRQRRARWPIRWCCN